MSHEVVNIRATTAARHKETESHFRGVSPLAPRDEPMQERVELAAVAMDRQYAL